MQAWVIGNWKQNPATMQEVDTLLDDLLTAIDSDEETVRSCQIMVTPSCIHLAHVSQRLKDSPILSAAQDISAHSDSIGAYTGDYSAHQIADVGATWTILGHSERRQYHQESNASLLQKITNAFGQNLGVVFCIGETQAQYDNKQTLTVLASQLAVIKELLESSSIRQTYSLDTLSERLIIAYEPVWAIGTGKVPTVAEVSATHQFIKQTVSEFAPSLSDLKVLYGGSVNADNAASFAADSMIDGALVGGASLKAESFLAIAKCFAASQH